MTNLERIRSAEIGKLADILLHLDGCPKVVFEGCNQYRSCRECWESWLEEEVNDDAL